MEEANSQRWELDYRRNFGEKEMEEWRELMHSLASVDLTKGADRVVWKLSKSGKFTSRSMYRFITFGGVIDTRMMEFSRRKFL